MPAGNVYAAPVGTPLGSSDWKLVGHTKDGVTMAEPFKLNADSAQLRFDKGYEGYDWPRSVTIPSGGWPRNDPWPNEDIDLLALQRRINKAAYDYSMPSRWLVGCTNPSINERSKPVGLTNEYKYTDRDGDWIEVTPTGADDPSDAVALLETGEDEGTGYGVYVTESDSIPLALNVLGYDRPKAGAMVQATVGYSSAAYSSNFISGSDKRDALLAEAAARLLAIDAYDQRVVERRAEEEAKAARAAELARQKLTEVVDHVAVHGVNRLHADSLQIAVADYKKAVDEVGAPSAL